MQKVLGIYLPDGDTHFPDMLRRSPLLDGKGTYQLNKIEAAIVLCKQKRVAVDIGAHVGLWSRVLARSFEKVHAFEPVREYLECLHLNIEEAKGKVLVCGNILLGSEQGIASVMRVASNSGNTHVGVLVEGEFEAGGVHLAMYRFDDLWEGNYVDFMKIDVEGYEYEVVLGAAETIKRTKPVMVVEQKPGNAERYGRKTGEVLDLLKSWGASIVWEKSGDYCLKWG